MKSKIESEKTDEKQKTIETAENLKSPGYSPLKFHRQNGLITKEIENL